VKGEVVGSDGKKTFEKMSKSKGNGVTPDSVQAKYGIDTLRVAIMAGAPPESDLNWDDKSVQNMKSFLDRVCKFSKTIDGELTSLEEILKLCENNDGLRQNFTANINLLADYERQIDVHRNFHVSVARLRELFNNLGEANEI
jgi:leucyl-tRNA synthetase